MRDRKAVARYAGLTGSPDESGAKRREQGSCPRLWCKSGSMWRSPAGFGRFSQAATAGSLTIGSSLNGAMVPPMRAPAREAGSPNPWPALHPKIPLRPKSWTFSAARGPIVVMACIV